MAPRQRRDVLFRLVTARLALVSAGRPPGAAGATPRPAGLYDEPVRRPMAPNDRGQQRLLDALLLGAVVLVGVLVALAMMLS